MNKMKQSFRLLTLAAAVAGFTGCNSVSPATIKGIAKGSVQFTVRAETENGKNADAVPYLRAANAVICSIGEGTNLSPAEVSSALESSSASALKTSAGASIMNLTLAVYSGLYDLWGSQVNKVPLLQAGLQGVCEGMAGGLPSTSPAAAAAGQRQYQPYVR